MNAIEFVKKYDLEKVINFINNRLKLDCNTEFLLNYSRTCFNPIQLRQDEFECDEYAMLNENEWYWVSRSFDKSDQDIIENDFVSVADLKQIVNAFEILKYFGGIDNAKYNLTNPYLSVSELLHLKQAVELVEKCK